jgi:hypothetical protein
MSYCMWRKLLVLLVLAGHAAMAAACAICAPPDGQDTVLYRLHVADAVVLAVPRPRTAAWQVVAQVKGHPSALPVERVEGVPAPTIAAAAVPTLLVYGAAAQRWRALGPLGLQRAEWLKRTLGYRPVSLAPVTDWSARLTHFARDLEDGEPLVAQMAYEEVSVAPYSAMRSLKPMLRAERIRHWLDDPALQARRPLYTLLAGFAGGPNMVADLMHRMAQADREAAPAALSAALAASLEALGPEGVAWVEQNYLARPGLEEFQARAVVLALGVHGNDGLRISRERVVAAYARLARDNPALAGLAASDLASWGHWELGPRYAEILLSGQPLAFASRYAMVFYLLRSPRPDARAALDALRAAKAL